MTSEIAESFASSLSLLTTNHQAHIGYLTMLAEDAIDYAPFIMQTILTHVQKARPDVKLPVLYLINSIMKEVGKAYITQFAGSIVQIFTTTYETVNRKARDEMLTLRQGWEDVFPLKTLNSLDANLHLMDPAWSPGPTPSTVEEDKKEFIISLDHVTELDNLAACTVCDQRMGEGPRRVICCVNGHGVCSVCREKLSVCPTCKEPFSHESQTLLRKLLDKLPRSCPNTGCSKVLPQSGILEHLTWCDHRSVRCCACDDSCEAQNIESHYETKHPDYLVQDDSMVFEIPVTKDKKCMALFKVAGGQMFRVKISLVESAEKMFTIGFEWVLREDVQDHQAVMYKVSSAILEKDGEEFKTSVKSTATLDLQDNMFTKVCLPVAADRTGDVHLKISFRRKEKNERKKKFDNESQGSSKKIKL